MAIQPIRQPITQRAHSSVAISSDYFHGGLLADSGTQARGLSVLRAAR
jgi:hypothetical protein